MIEQNKAICLELLRCICTGNVEGFSKLLADDATWWVQGNWAGAGRFTKAQIIPAIAGVTTVFDKGLDIQVTGITAEGERVAIEAISKGVLKDGSSYENSYHFLYRLRDSKVIEGKEYLDTMVVNETLGPIFTAGSEK